ncbi:NAD(P)/FAD-dependent oxidoreductase [Streptomyces sp. NPDC101151]|uniref:NAD(P)/FAD-dependent oxidoreductase n=1 Tax=Streptomyces sp. NPDC101151 TaxID=3366115 RepID=UPI00381EA84E
MPKQPKAGRGTGDGHRVVVLGGGYTGMLAAIRLAHRTRRTGVRVTLVNPTVRFTERLRMHQAATGQGLAVHHIPDLLAGTGVAFVRGRATALDPRTRTVTVAESGQSGQSGESGEGGEGGGHSAVLPYDTLIYALGSRADTSGVPGAEEHAYTLDGHGPAGRLSVRLAEAADAGGTVTVCGGGLTGVEAATEIAESYPGLSVTLLCAEEPGAMMGERARSYLRGALSRLGVTVRTGARVTRVLPDAVELATGEAPESAVCVWTAGVRVSPLAARAGLAVDERGLLLVDETLRSVSHPEIHAIGDAAAVHMPWGRLHGTCQSGMPTAAYTADAIARLLRGRPVRPFRFGYVHQPVSLGRRDAVIQFTHADDTPRRVYLKGRAAVRYKELVSGSPLPFYRLSRRMNVMAAVSRAGRARTGAAAAPDMSAAALTG